MKEEIYNEFDTQKVLTYSDVLSSFHDGFIDQLLRISAVLCAFNLYVLMYTYNMETPGWIEFFESKSTDKNVLALKILKSGSMVALILSIFLTYMVIGYKMGWN